MSGVVASGVPTRPEGAEAVISTAGDTQAFCFICLSEGSADKPLERPCKCETRPVHRTCLARWQLHNSGKSEERQCRFCHEVLPDWQPTLLGNDTDDVAAPKPLMAAVCWGNQVYKIPILPGPEGKAAFKRRVHELFGLGLSSRFEVTFECKVQADKLSLRGLNAYEAATRCAAMSARRAGAADGETSEATPAAAGQGAEPAV